MPGTINMFWHGTALSPIDEICIQSFVNRGHLVHLFTYAAVDAPAGVISEDAAAILPYERFFTYDGSPSAFSNIFRYRLLWERGGWWFDTDVLCLKDELPDCDYYWAEEDPGFINGAVLKFPAGHPLCLELLKQSEERSRDIKDWGYLGPDLLTEVLRDFVPAGLAGRTEDVYPVSWREAHFFWFPEFRDRVERRTRGSSFIHLWNSIFKRMEIDVRTTPPDGSFLRPFYDALGFSFDQELPIEQCRKAVERYLEPCLQQYPVRLD